MLNDDELLRAYCLSKTAYATQRAARTNLNRRHSFHPHADKAANVNRIRPYRCIVCGAWHLGHAPSSRSLRHLKRRLKLLKDREP